MTLLPRRRAGLELTQDDLDEIARGIGRTGTGTVPKYPFGHKKGSKS
jgi:hypothetical protein